MAKQLKLSDIKKENKIYEQTQRVELSDEFYVNIYPHFSPTKVNELIKEMITDKERAEKAGIDFDKINMADWAMFNIVYKFADLGIASDIKNKVKGFTELIDYEYFGKILESFPEESINKVQEALDRFNKNLEELAKSELEKGETNELGNNIVQ